MSFPYQFKIGETYYYATHLPEWNPYGKMVYANTGQPIPYGPGNFSVVIRGIPYSDAAASSIPASGTYLNLVNSWMSSHDSGLSITVYDPRIDNYITINGRMAFPQLFTGYSGTSLVDVRLEFRGAFLSSGQLTTYTGGYIEPGNTSPLPEPVYIPGDPIPPPTTGLDYFFGTGRYGYGFYGRGEGV